MDEYEQILLVKQEVFVYRIPPRATSRGVRAADWKLDAPDWTGRMRLVAKGKECILKLEDKISGELFAQCPIDKYPGVAIEAVTDSSRYFVVRLEGDGRTAFIGMGFSDRGDSFDLNVALQDHFKWIQKTEELEDQKAKPDDGPRLDLGFKDGQTITINMNIAKKSGSAKARAKPSTTGIGMGLLPPPPGSAKVPGPPSAKNSPPAPSPADAPSSASSSQLLLDLMGGETAMPTAAAAAASVPAPEHQGDLWGDFAAAPKSTAATDETPKAGNWVQF